MAGNKESINISKASTTTNLFFLFFHGGKAAVVPFLTLFFRLLGLTSLETGTIIAVKTLTSFVWAPLWARCATAYSRHRLVLVISIFMMIITYLSFPALYYQLSKPEHCYPTSGSSNHNYTQSEPQVSSSPVTSPVWPVISTPPGYYSTTQRPVSTTTRSLNLSAQLSTINTDSDELVRSTVSTNFEASTLTQDLLLVATPTLVSTVRPNRNKKLPQHNPDISNKIFSSYDSETGGSTRALALKKRDWTGQVKDTLHSIQSTLLNDRFVLFLVLLAITVGGEIFASPVEKVADDSWFDFLNRIDDLERYGQQRFWGSLAFVITPIAVTVAVDYTPCFLFANVHHFLLHFYIFAILLSAALIVACCYPVPPPSGGKHSSKVCKGLQIVCSDARGFFFSVTLLLAGMVYASYHNFLFWRIQDLGGLETPMGLCVSVAAFAEIPMLILSGRMVKKLGESWMVSVSIFMLSVRVLCYAFILEPWAFVPVELTHGITHTSLWFAVLSYDEFNVGVSVDRSIRSILSSFYFGIGFSAGSVVSGYIFNVYGSSVLFWGCAAVTCGWCLLFTVVQRCLPKKEKVRYIKLLRSDSDNSEDEEDDWLEMALKDH